MPSGPPFFAGTYGGAAGPDVPCVIGGAMANDFAAIERGVVLCEGGGVGFGGGVLMRAACMIEKISGFTYVFGDAKLG